MRRGLGIADLMNAEIKSRGDIVDDETRVYRCFGESPLEKGLGVQCKKSAKKEEKSSGRLREHTVKDEYAYP